MAKKLLSPKQAKVYVELRKIGATPSQAESWVNRRVTAKGKIKRKK